MALLETLQRRVEQLGLIPKLVKSLPRVSVLLSILGIAWILTLPMDGQYRNTYISENALMPSQAYNFFRESEWNFVRGYREEVVAHLEDSIYDRNALLQNWLDEVGYKTSILNYTSAYDGVNKPILFAIYHAPKGDDTEAMVLAAPWRTEDGDFNRGGVSLAVGMARYFHRLSIWSKNIIVVFPENAQDALKYWVDSYHTNLDQTGGSIESAAVLEYPSGGDGVDFVEISYVGLNGQLPNLDLINCAVMISEHEAD
ncbi:unnamed protein product [Ambrosiozyma monospora]|uniref:Unnamed protein product n=1 Tax=Ambrosiozyma monospora TaxID=43982 RepID=A0ACB5TEC0_AMBMO|nr:unnamed protein product [Ambrosiozyma monospora]